MTYDSFDKTSLQGVQTIHTILKLYRLALGENINLEKSTIVFISNKNPAVTEDICCFLNIKEVLANLGLPSIIGH